MGVVNIQIPFPMFWGGGAGDGGKYAEHLNTAVLGSDNSIIIGVILIYYALTCNTHPALHIRAAKTQMEARMPAAPQNVAGAIHPFCNKIPATGLPIKRPRPEMKKLMPMCVPTRLISFDKLANDGPVMETKVPEKHP